MSGFPFHHQLPELLRLMSIKSVMPSTISSSVVPFSFHSQSFPASGSFPTSQFFTSSGQSIGSFSFSISPSNEYSGLISFRMDWLDLLAVQQILRSLPQHNSPKASILWCSQFKSINSLDFLAVQGTLKSLLQHYSSKTSILLPQLSL